MEQIAPASIILSSAHYQSTLALSCAGINCFGSFPSPGAHHRLRITRMSCLLTGDPSSAFGLGYMRLEKADDSLLQLEFLPVDYSAPDGSHTLNRDVDMQVGANQHIYVQLALGTGSAGSGAARRTGSISPISATGAVTSSNVPASPSFASTAIISRPPPTITRFSMAGIGRSTVPTHAA